MTPKPEHVRRMEYSISQPVPRDSIMVRLVKCAQRASQRKAPDRRVLGCALSRITAAGWPAAALGRERCVTGAGHTNRPRLAWEGGQRYGASNGVSQQERYLPPAVAPAETAFLRSKLRLNGGATPNTNNETQPSFDQPSTCHKPFLRPQSCPPPPPPPPSPPPPPPPPPSSILHAHRPPCSDRPPVSLSCAIRVNTLTRFTCFH
ncbi:hypothetical protein CIHG_09015 [Coccidioides immitis H538.4]|uniref:Uncharacterized protein n=1 Tax=Coccidioides immitis H538.4 TaxID=396776 RepID=A0A0J8UTZ1_COCIT|nr:hypothetical protein CIHG_09015 [Coccidioides immitis H538.4]